MRGGKLQISLMLDRDRHQLLRDWSLAEGKPITHLVIEQLDWRKIRQLSKAAVAKRADER